MLDLYCERIAPGFWAEPVNALTNFGFVLVAVMLWHGANRDHPGDTRVALLNALIVAIGIGSFLFHTLASELSRWLDLLPIFIFQLLYLFVYCRGVVNLAPAVSALLAFLFLLGVLTMSPLAGYLNGSLVYAPTCLVMLALGWYRNRSDRTQPGLLLIAAAVFLLAITLRSIDVLACDYFHTGTHFLWHLLSAAAIYLAMRALIHDLAGRNPSR